MEGEVGTFRRNHWVPVPQAQDLEALNAQLLQGCQEDGARTVTGREQTVGTALLLEREHLLPLAEEPFDLVEVSFPTVTTLRACGLLSVGPDDFRHNYPGPHIL